MEEDEILDGIITHGSITKYLGDKTFSLEALERLSIEGLIFKRQTATYYLTSEGIKAIEKGGYNKYKLYIEDKEKNHHISVSGNAVIGSNNNTNISQGRSMDLKNLSNNSMTAPIAANDKQINNNISESIFDIVKKWGPLATIASALLAYWTFFHKK